MGSGNEMPNDSPIAPYVGMYEIDHDRLKIWRWFFYGVSLLILFTIPFFLFEVGLSWLAAFKISGAMIVPLFTYYAAKAVRDVKTIVVSLDSVGLEPVGKRYRLGHVVEVTEVRLVVAITVERTLIVPYFGTAFAIGKILSLRIRPGHASRSPLPSKAVSLGSEG